MRRYQHKPDRAWIERSFVSEKEDIDVVTETVQRSGRGAGRLLVFDTAVDTVLDAARLGWALGEPVDVVRPWFVQASIWVGEAVERGRALDGNLAERWLAVALVACNWGVAEQVAGRVPDHIEGLAGHEPLAREFLVALSGLAAGESPRVAQAATAMGEASQGPSSSPVTNEGYEGLAALAAAVAMNDQASFDVAVRARTAAMVRRCKRSVEGRRHPECLLDLRGAAIAAVAHRAGLQLPRDNAYLGTELLQVAG